MITVWGDTLSGNCYKVKLLLEQTGVEYCWKHVDIMQGESHSDDFLERNPNGKIPLVQLDNGQYLSESNAILWYFSHGSKLRPSGPEAEAQLLQWMFFEQYSHEPNIATSRYLIRYCGGGPEHDEALAERYPKGHAALAVMEQTLADNDYLVGNRYSIADIALYAYTHVAEEGGFELSMYSGIQRWCKRVAQQKGHVTIG